MVDIDPIQVQGGKPLQWMSDILADEHAQRGPQLLEAAHKATLERETEVARRYIAVSDDFCAGYQDQRLSPGTKSGISKTPLSPTFWPLTSFNASSAVRLATSGMLRE